MSEDNPVTQALAAVDPFWVTPRGTSYHAFVLVPHEKGGDTHGPFTASGVLDAIKALQLTERAEQHTRDCSDCAFDLVVYREAPPGAPDPLCPVGRQLAEEAAAARGVALGRLGVLHDA